MKIIIVLLMALSFAFAYQKGDLISPQIVQKLQLKKEKIYIIDFFASWCESCKKEMPHLSTIHNTLKNTNVELIGIDVDEDIKKAEKFQKELKDENKLTFKVINDPQNNIIKEFDPIGMPSLYFIKENRVTDAIIGATDNIDKKIINTLKELK